MTGVKKFRTYITWGKVSTIIICLPLKIFPPSLIGKSQPLWKGADLMSGTANTSACVLVKGIGHKTPRFVDLAREDYQKTCLGWFIIIFLYYLFQDTLLSEKNVAIDGRVVKMGEILKYIGMWLLMANVVTSCDIRSWFDNMTKPSEWEGALFRIHKYMSVGTFEQIVDSLRFTNKTMPSFRDRFDPIRDILATFDIHTKKYFVPGWVSCIDESMCPFGIKSGRSRVGSFVLVSHILM